MTGLKYSYFKDGKELGSISATIHVSDDGDLSGDWATLPVYGQKTQVEDGLAKVAGYVESIPGKHIGIILTWRSKKGSLPKTWENEQDLYVYYFLDGRSHPVMEYSILHPGAKNPLPLSGLWKSDSVRFPLRWKRRMDSEGTAKHGVPHILAKSASKGPKGAYAPAIDTQDDLASFRISVHSKEAEALLAQAKMGPTIPVNRTHVPQENVLYVAQELSEYVDLKAPASEKASTIQNLLNTTNELPRSAPLVEFRIYYKSASLLEDLGIKPAGSMSGVPSSIAMPWSERPVSTDPLAHSGPARINGSNVRPRQSNSHLEDSPFERPSKKQKTTATPARGTSDSTPTPRNAVGADPATASTTSRLAGPASARRTNATSTSSSGNPAMSGQTPSSSLPRTSSTLYSNGNAATPSSSSSTAAASPRPTAPGFQRPSSSAARTPATDQAGSSSFTHARPQPQAQSSQVTQEQGAGMSSAAGGTRKDRAKQAALYFLREIGVADEDEDDPEADEENVQALLKVGFKNKAKFLSALPTCDESTREEILSELRAGMGRLEYGVLLGYLKRECGI